MGYRIDLGAWNGIFAVPCDIVDRQLRLADGNKIKVLLYLLRHSGRAVEPCELAQLCGISEGDAADAVEYWHQEGILACKADALSIPDEPTSCTQPTAMPEAVYASAPLAPLQQEVPAQEHSPEPAPAALRPKAKERIRYAYNECAEMMNEDCELRHMLTVLEGLLAKNLNHTEISVFITLVKWYGLPTSCVALLVEYCREIGRSSISYIETTGIGWVNEDITTVEQVMDKVNRLRSARSAWSHLRSLMDIPERSPTKKEQEYSSVWISDWQTADELILLAYERCVDAKGKLSMSYMNGILSNWRKNGITTAEQAMSESRPENIAPSKPDKKEPRQSSSGMYETVYDQSDIDAVLDEDWLDQA